MNKKILFKLLTFAFILVVGYLLYGQLSSINLSEVKNGFKKVTFEAVALTATLAILNFMILTTYDYMGFRTLGLKYMRYPRVLISAFICYVFTLNIGAFVGGLGFRYRIYSGWKVPKNTIPYIILFSVLSNWSGHVLLLGIVGLYQFDRVQEVLRLPGMAVALLIASAFAVIVGYLFLCFKGYSRTIKKVNFTFPKLSVGFIQLGLSSLQWCTLSMIIFIFLDELGAEVNFAEVLFTLLLAGIAGVVTHIPAGLGVVEAIFLEVGPDIVASKILVGLICYRAIYYFFPLFIAIPSYFFLEYYQKNKLNNRKELFQKSERISI